MFFKSSSEKLITYEELMNSHFMRYPSSPKWLYNMFNPVVVMITLAAAVIIAGKILNIDHALVAMITFITSWITYRRHTTYRLFVGHGIGHIKKGKFSFLKLPTTGMSISSIVMLLLTISMIIATFTKGFRTGLQPDTVRSYQLLSVSMFTAFAVSLLTWRFRLFYETWYGDEYKARLEFKNKGYGKIQIEKNIKELKRLGILL